MRLNRWAIVEGHYWFYVHYHEGMNSWMYKRMCGISEYFKPGLRSEQLLDEDSAMVYQQLESKYLRRKHQHGSKRYL